MGNEIDRLLKDRPYRGVDLLKRAGLGAGLLMVPGAISACGGGTTTTTGRSPRHHGGRRTDYDHRSRRTAEDRVRQSADRTGCRVRRARCLRYRSGPQGPGERVDIGGKQYSVEIIDKDGQSNPAQGAAVAQELINSDKVDLILATSTPETTNPVADACRGGGRALHLDGVPVGSLVLRPRRQGGRALAIQVQLPLLVRGGRSSPRRTPRRGRRCPRTRRSA